MIKKYRYAILLVIWLAGVILDRLWFSLDHSVPAWDQADYLNGAVNYYQAWQQAEWWRGDWWRDLWLLSTKIPPLTYLLTVPFLQLGGINSDAATLVMLPLAAILLLTVYYLGTWLFSPQVGLMAAAICQLLPGLYRYRLDYLLDYPLTVAVTGSFTLLTLWKLKGGYLWAIAWGISWGLALLVKQPALFFLLLPWLWLVGISIKQRQWGKLTQLLLGWLIGIVVCFPWYRTNWLLILTSGKRATIDSAIAEGDPALNTLAAWTYYLRVLPYLVSWLLILICLLGLLLYWWRQPSQQFLAQRRSLIWLLVFLSGGYLLSSANLNKDPRYILPLLPTLALVLALGLESWKGRFGYYLRGVSLSLSFFLLLLNLFPLGLTTPRNYLSPGIEHYPYTGKPWPLLEVIARINETSPYLHSTLGVLPSLPELNQHNFSFYGSQLAFPVSGRQVGVRESELLQDAASLDWFVTKTGEQGSIPQAQPLMVELVENDPAFYLEEDWQLPDRSVLKLHHRRQPSLLVEPANSNISQVHLDSVIVPPRLHPGVAVPITYRWSGSKNELKDGIVLLSWVGADPNQGKSFWVHDHGIGMGRLNWSPSPISENFQVTENLAMFPDADLPPGNYTLQAEYLNRRTQTTYTLAVPPIRVNLSPNNEVIPAPELDLISQLRLAAPGLAQGIPGLEPIFTMTARINQYDPNQDYLQQAEIAFSHRLNAYNPSEFDLDWAYTVALAAVLQQDVPAAISSIQRVIELAPDNPYNYAYLAFVYLYDWRPRPANQAINQAISLDPQIQEFKVLRGITALFQGNLWQAWQDLQVLRDNSEVEEAQ